MRTSHAPVLVLVAACANVEPLDPNIENQRTITQGIYGQAIAVCDTPDCTATYDIGLRASLVQPRVSEGELFLNDARVVTRTVSGAKGFYELASTPGSYSLCATWFNATVQKEQVLSCYDVVVLDGAPQRVDFAAGEGIGWHPPT